MTRTPHPDLLALVKRAWDECGNITKTAAWLGVSAATARNWLSDLGLVAAAKRRTFRAKLSQAQAAEIRLRLGIGESPAELAAEYDVSLTTVSQIKHKRIYWPEPVQP